MVDLFCVMLVLFCVMLVFADCTLLIETLSGEMSLSFSGATLSTDLSISLVGM